MAMILGAASGGVDSGGGKGVEAGGVGVGGATVGGAGVLVTVGVLLVTRTALVSSYADDDVLDVVVSGSGVVEIEVAVVDALVVSDGKVVVACADADVLVIGDATEVVSCDGVLVTADALLVTGTAVVVEAEVAACGAGLVEVVISGPGVVEVVAACVVVSFTALMMVGITGITGAADLTSSTVKLEAAPRVAILLSSFSTADKVVSVWAARGA